MNLQKVIYNFSSQATIGLLSFVSLWGECFLRHSFGERYLSGVRMFMSILSFITTLISLKLLWSAFLFSLYATRGVPRSIIESSSNGRIYLSIIFGLMMIFMMIYHRAQIVFRNQRGVQWHSFANGSSHIQFNQFKPHEIKRFVEPLIFIFLALISIRVPIGYLGGLFLFIGIALFFKETILHAQLRNRYLDAIDAKIEADTLTDLLEKGWAPNNGREESQFVDNQGFEVTVPIEAKSLGVFLRTSAATNPLIAQRLKAKPNKAARNSPNGERPPSEAKVATPVKESHLPDND